MIVLFVSVFMQPFKNLISLQVHSAMWQSPPAAGHVVSRRHDGSMNESSSELFWKPGKHASDDLDLNQNKFLLKRVVTELLML